MSEEEKYIIKTLKGSIDTYIEGTKVTTVQLTIKETEILLNLIEKLQRENEKLSELLELTRCDLHNTWSTEKGCRKEIEKQNKVIDLMAENSLFKVDEDNQKILSKEQIIGYFLKKVEEENE